MDHMQEMSQNVYTVIPERNPPGGQMPPLRESYAAGSTFTLTEEIRGAKGRQYGREGDWVKIVSDHDNVMIVENINTGERFPVPIEKIKRGIDADQNK